MYEGREAIAQFGDREREKSVMMEDDGEAEDDGEMRIYKI